MASPPVPPVPYDPPERQLAKPAAAAAAKRGVRTRIVGIGASAGGLAALEQFFQQVPEDSGLAYVVVQHLNAIQKPMLVELLQRIARIPVSEAEDRAVIQPDHVYVIPPNADLRITEGRIRLRLPDEPRGMRLPINILFSSLAQDQGERAIAVILSGMGSDGTQGLHAVRAMGGLVAVQDPACAQFDSMPRSAIDAGLADMIGRPDALPEQILAYSRQTPTPSAEPATVADVAHVDRTVSTELSYKKIFVLLQQHTRHDFSMYKSSTVIRRIERRMAIHAIPSVRNYADYLEQNVQEIDLLFKELLIGVTSFFRDAAMWEQLEAATLPALLARRRSDQDCDKKLRAWVAACSTGEEAYSLAILFKELVQREPEFADFTLQIFATDLSPDAIATARRGQYPASICTDVSPERLARFFTAHDGSYRVTKEIRDCVLFAQHDVVLDPPFTKLDMLFCRNLMIYFDAKLQRRLLPLFHYSMRPGAMLVLGSSETIGSFHSLFEPVDVKLRVYTRRKQLASGGADLVAKSFPPLSFLTKDPSMPKTAPPEKAAESLQAAADRALLQGYTPAAVLVNSAGDIVYISGRTGKYLEPAAGKANLNFHAMVREGLRAPVVDALNQAAAQPDPVQLRNLPLQADAGLQRVDVTVQCLREAGPLKDLLLIVFRDTAVVPVVRGRRKIQSALESAHEQELQQCRDEIRVLREQTRASQEELQAAIEELQSTNEELQSANEELTTSREEMQSMNEELQTVNSEMQTKLDDLSLAQSDMKNLLNSTNIAMLFLDSELNVRRYTDRASRIINLRESDIGRPFSDLTTTLQYPTLHEDAQETLRTLVFSEKQIATNDGRWFSVRIMPYKRLDNVIDGAVITFVDITTTKELESRLRNG